jgi:hypothetical protein
LGARRFRPVVVGFGGGAKDVFKEGAPESLFAGECAERGARGRGEAGEVFRAAKA